MACSGLIQRWRFLIFFLDPFSRESFGSFVGDIDRSGGSRSRDPSANPDASSKLAGQLSNRGLRPNQQGVQSLMDEHLLPACHRWIQHVMDRQPPQGRGPWVPGRYHLQPIDLWLNCQKAGDYNPTHTHGGSFSGVIFLKVPPQINADSFDGQLCFHGPEGGTSSPSARGWRITCFGARGFYVFPAWQPHSVMPFRGDGKRWSLAFNVVAASGQQPASGFGGVRFNSRARPMCPCPADARVPVASDRRWQSEPRSQQSGHMAGATFLIKPAPLRCRPNRLPIN